MSASLEADREAIAAFVGALFRYADAGSFVSLRAFRDDRDGTWQPGRWPVRKLNGAGLGPVIDAAVVFANDCANAPVPVVFAPPVCTLKNEKGAAEDDVANGVVLSVECDARPAEARRQLEGILGLATVVAASGGEWACPETGEVSPRLHLHWRLQEPTRELADHARLKEARELAQKLTGADGSAVPLVHPMRWPGSWHRKATPRLARIVALNEDKEIDLGDALDLLRGALAASGQESEPLSEHKSGEPEADALDVAAALAVIPNDFPPKDSWEAWNRIGMAVWAATGGSASGLAAFMAWSEKSPKCNEVDVRERWNNYKKFPPGKVGAGTLFYLAKQARPGWEKPSAIFFIAPRTSDPFADYGNGHTNQREKTTDDQQKTTDDEEDFSAGQQQQFDTSLYTVQGWLGRDLPEPDILLGPFSTTGRGLFVADTGLGKTNVAMGIAFAMASGQPFLHWSCNRAARVLFIDGEMSKRLLRQRIRDAAGRCGTKPGGLYFLSRDDVETMPPLNTAEGQQFVSEFINRLGSVDFVFFDNIQSLLVGDMKDEESWQQTLPWVRSLTRYGIGQMWIHHTGHNTGRAYGTKTREWQLDTVMLAEAIERASTDIAFALQFTKARERTPENRRDFDPVVVTLANDRWSVEGAAPRKGKAPSPLGKKFFAALLDAIVAAQVVSPASAKRPAATNATWIGECGRLGLLDTSTDQRSQHTSRSLFSKYRRELTACEWVACNGNLT